MFFARDMSCATSQQLYRIVVDDGSNVVTVVIWRNNIEAVLSPLNQSVLKLGSFLAIRGRLNWRADECEIVASRIFQAKSPNAELVWWMDVKRAHDVYCERPPCITYCSQAENMDSSDPA